jgi:TRAP-type C4-dicarboxylate transport system permease small subunit
MQLYAERPIRRTAQLVSDLLALLLVVVAVWLGTTVYDEVMKLRAPGDGLVDAGTGLRGTFDNAANSSGGIPLIGDALAKALHGGSDVGTKLADAGRWQIDAVESLAWWMAAIIIALPVLALVVTAPALELHPPRLGGGALARPGRRRARHPRAAGAGHPATAPAGFGR